MDTGEKFKAARAAAGLTQEQAAATREKVCWCTCWLEKKYRVINDGPEMVVQISHYKKKAGAGIAFMAAGAVIAVVGITMM